MPSVSIEHFGGMQPAVDNRSGQETDAALAVDVNLYDGVLRPLRSPKLCDTKAFDVKGMALIPHMHGENYGLMAWSDCTRWVPKAAIAALSGRTVPLVLRSGRLFWVDPSDHDNLVSVSVDAPTTAPIVTVLSPGVGTVEDRLYTFTYVNAWGVESPPAPVTAAYTVADDGSVLLSGLGGAPANATHMRIYRSVGKFEDGRQAPNTAEGSFQLVRQVPVAAIFTDNYTLLDAHFGTLMTDAECPPPLMDNVVGTEGGWLVGFKGNELFVSYRHMAHNWPTQNRLTLPDKIVNIVATGDVVYVVTEGNPYYVKLAYDKEVDIIEPVAFDEPYPCIAPDSLVSAPTGALYATGRGLVLLTPQRPAHLISKDRIPEDAWGDFAPNLAVWHRGSYYGFRSPESGGFIMDINEPSEGQIAIGEITRHTVNIDAAHAGHDGVLYVARGGGIYRWGKGDARPYTWKSRVISANAPTAMNTLRLLADYGPAVNVKVWADGKLVCDKTVTDMKPSRLGRFGRAREFTIQLQGVTPVYDVKLATSAKELRE